MAVMSPALLMVTAFVAGMAVMVLELLGSRVIGPVYGVSLYVWASLIATALLALSLGYWIGGRVADRWPKPAVLFGTLSASGALTCLIPLFRGPVLRLGAPLGVRGGSLLSAILLFLPPIACLGAISPLAVRLHARSLSSVGGSAGKLAAASSVGSVCGTLLAGFVLIPSLPLDTLVALLGVFLAVHSLVVWLAASSGRGVLASIIVILGGVFSATLRPPALVHGMRVVHREETLYGQLRVVDAGGIRYLMVNGSFQGEIDLKTGLPTARYIHVMAAACRAYADPSLPVLVLGLGPGTLPTLLTRAGFTVEGVDIDRAVVRAATRFFGYRPTPGTVHVEDARRFCATARGPYGAILLDVFSSEALPEHLLTREALLTYRRLLPHGFVAMNLVGFVEGDLRKVPDAVIRTLRSVFAHTAVWFVPHQEGHEPTGNLVILASDAPLEERDLAALARETQGDKATGGGAILLPWEVSFGPVVTDRFNPLASWNAPVDLAIRTLLFRYLTVGFLSV